MPLTEANYWSEHLRQNLHLYEESLLRQIASRLIRPRSHWPVKDLVARMVEATENAAVVDRRLRELSLPSRQLLGMVGRSRLARWYAGHLIELLAALGLEDPLAEIMALLESGLMYPELASSGRGEPPATEGESQPRRPRCQSLTAWFAHSRPEHLTLCVHPAVSRRALSEPLGFADWRTNNAETVAPKVTRESDGLEWPLRLAVLWQQARSAPLRRTQQGDLFKRDLDRIRNDSLLARQPADHVGALPDIGLLAAALSMTEGVLQQQQSELHAAAFPNAWSHGLAETLASLWAAMLQVDRWNTRDGWSGEAGAPHPFSSAYFLCLLLLAEMPEENWCAATDVAGWVVEHHPFWRKRNSRRTSVAAKEQDSLVAFLLGVAYTLKMVQAAPKTSDEWLVRLSPLGRWIVGRGEKPRWPTYQQTLLAQPNLDILVYRQGLTPDLVGKLSQFAQWTAIDAACHLQLEPQSVYSALESGETFESILQIFQQHGIKPPPAPVVDSLRTWAKKHERITIYPQAMVLEFLSEDDLTQALARGVAAIRISDHLAVIPNEASIDYRHFRLTSNRDYTLPPEKCVTVEEDGVTLCVDLSRSDLMLESELRRFAEELQSTVNERRFRVTPSSLRNGEEAGISLPALEMWFQSRCDRPLPSAVRLLLSAGKAASVSCERMLVLQLPDEDVTDGLLQWPETRGLLGRQLGPTAVAISEDQLPHLDEKLRLLGMQIEYRIE